MAIDPRFIPAFSIETVILDKDTGEPLSGGIVSFQEDNQPGILKPVYQITGTSPAYTYIQLPNPMTLSSIGTFEDALGNPVVPYFFPFDADGNPDYYLVVVTSSGGVPQFDRVAVPYIPDTDEIAAESIITNELSNPQFSQVLFDTTTASTYTYTFMGVTNQEVKIAPDWSIIVTCPTSGSVTVGQLTPVGTANIITNPGTILNISSAGVSTLLLRQRLLGSPNLWGNGFISGSFVAKTYSGTNTNLIMYYSQSGGTVMAVPIVTAILPSSGAYVAKAGVAQIPASSNTGDFPTAYVDIYFEIPSSTEVDITSVIVAGTGEAPITDILYDQIPWARMTDQLYHYAYPIVPIGTIVDFGGFIVPAHYYLCDGTAYNRISNYLLFSALTMKLTVTLTSTMNTFTVVSAANLHIGMALEGTGIPVSTTISNISGTTVTMSNSATTTGPSLVTFFAWGNGDGSSTFNVPNLQGYVSAGANGTLLANSNGVGLKGGANTVVLTTGNLPPHNHSLPWLATVNSTTGPGGFAALSNGSGATGPGPGASDPVSIVQSTALVKKCIRFE